MSCKCRFSSLEKPRPASLYLGFNKIGVSADGRAVTAFKKKTKKKEKKKKKSRFGVCVCVCYYLFLSLSLFSTITKKATEKKRVVREQHPLLKLSPPRETRVLSL